MHVSQYQMTAQKELINQKLSSINNCLRKYNVESEILQQVNSIVQEIKQFQNKFFEVLRQNDQHFQQQKLESEIFLTCKGSFSKQYSRQYQKQQQEQLNKLENLTSQPIKKQRILKKSTYSGYQQLQSELNDCNSQQFKSIQTVKANSESSNHRQNKQIKSRISNGFQRIAQPEFNKIDQQKRQQKNQQSDQPLVSPFKSPLNQSYQKSAFVGSEIRLSKQNQSVKDSVLSQLQIKMSDSQLNINNLSQSMNKKKADKKNRKSKLRLNDLVEVFERYRQSILDLLNQLLNYFVKQYDYIYGKKFIPTRNLEKLRNIYHIFKIKTQIKQNDYQMLEKVLQITEQGLRFLKEQIRAVLANQITRIFQLRINESVYFSIEKYQQ